MPQMQITILCLALALGVVCADNQDNHDTQLRNQLRSLLSKRTEGAAHDDDDDDDHHKLHPKLKPKSDRVFYKFDYPDNEQPPVTKHYTFKHPFPQVQEDKVYDADYVKDENADNGEWQAQMEYDTLRNKIRKLNEGVSDHKIWAEKAKKEMEEAEKDWRKAQDDIDAAKGNAQKAEEEYKESDAKVEDLTGETYKESLNGGNGTVGGKIGEAVEKVKKEMKEFKECKKELEEKRAKLHKLLEEHEDHLQAKAEADAEKAEADRLEKEAKAKHDKEMKEVEDEEEEAEEAEKSREQLEKEIKETEADLDKAAAKLRDVRGEKGDAPTKEKSAASFPLPSATVLLMVLAIVVSNVNPRLCPLS